jgi:hypothetical protein|tara:strand:+ start:510 stop:1100 length:591 start_codon:yes stop_codon:yes gene_type:complete
MTVIVDPELGVPIPPDKKHEDLRGYIDAACNTVRELSEHGLEVDTTIEDKDVAAKLALAYAENPEGASKKVTKKKAATLTPASIVMTRNILEEFGRSVAESAVQIRHMVTNKLVLETDNPDPRIRIRALELLGKISDVGLFADKSEVTITHQSTEDLRLRLRSKLAKLVNPEPEDVVVINGDVIDVSEELGIKDDH